MKKIIVAVFAGVMMASGAMAAPSTGVGVNKAPPDCGAVKASMQDAVNNQKAEIRSNDKQKEEEKKESNETDAA